MISANCPANIKRESVQELYINLVETIKKAAADVGMAKTVCVNESIIVQSKPWYEGACPEEEKIVIDKLCKFGNNRMKRDLLVSYVAAKKEYKALLRNKKVD